MGLEIPNISYRHPTDCAITPKTVSRIAIVGSCAVAGWNGLIQALEPGCIADYVLVNHVSTPVYPVALSEYDLQIYQVPLRSVLPDGSYFSTKYNDKNAWQKVFDDAVVRLSQFLEAALAHSEREGLLTFVTNFMVPQQNSLGRLLPRYDLRNIVYFVECLNKEIDAALKYYSNCYILDMDSIASTIGRRYVQDDVLWPTNHGASLLGFEREMDSRRLEPVEGSALDYYPSKLFDLIDCAWHDVKAMTRTIHQIDSIKLVIFDADDTLWRGVAAEMDGGLSGADIEGWPLGVIETLGILKRGGIMLALVSKNDPEKLSDQWQRVYGGSKRFPYEDFTVKKVNWSPKADNIAEVLRETNILAGNALFIDDNPLERAAVKEAFPAIRVLGRNPYIWRRILLWAPELQVAHINEEAANRTEMVQAQIGREDARKRLSRAEFLATLNLSVSMEQVSNDGHPKFQRALELINKTNQFNTTGRRWTFPEMKKLLDLGGDLFCFDVADRFTEYGTVGVIIWKDDTLLQFVMSCRVFGLDVEHAALAAMIEFAGGSGATEIFGQVVETEKNVLCRNLYRDAGFEPNPRGWRRATTQPPPRPSHVALTAPHDLVPS